MSTTAKTATKKPADAAELPTSIALRGRLAYSVNLKEMTEAERYEITLVVKKSDPKLAVFKQMVDAVAAEKFGAKVKGFASPIKDGDVLNENDAYKHRDNAFRDCVVIKSKTKFVPHLFSRDADGGKEKVGPEAFASGDDVLVVMNPWAYDVSGNKGVSCSPTAILLVAKGSRPIGGSGASASAALDAALGDIDLDADLD